MRCPVRPVKTVDYDVRERGIAMPTPKQPIKVLIPFDATREQIEKAVEQILGPDPEKSKPTA